MTEETGDGIAGTHVIVTGAASGIGRATAEAFAARGAIVTGVDLDAAALAVAMERIDADPAAQLVADLSDVADVGTIIARAWRRHPVAHLVNAAGIYPSTPFLQLTSAMWDRVLAVNVRAPMLLTTALARAVQDDPCGRGASVVNISSGAALRARPGAAPYSTSKAALEMLTRASALEVGHLAIRVNAVSPGFIAVNSTANPIRDDYAQKISRNPLGRRGTPQDIAKAVLWVSSGEAGWVTGSIVRVDGGASTGAMDLPPHWDGVTGAQEGRGVT